MNHTCRDRYAPMKVKRTIFVSIILILLAFTLTGLFQLETIPEVHASGISRVQGNCRGTTNGGSIISVTLASTPVSGDTLIAVVSASSLSSFISVLNITETNVNWFSNKDIGATSFANSNFLDVEIWQGNVTSNAGTSVTVNLSGEASEGGAADICEYSGLNPCVLNVTAYTSGTGNSALTGTTIPTSAQLDIGGIVTYEQLPSSPTNNFTLLDGQPIIGPQYWTTLSYLESIVPSSGAAGSSVTLSAYPQNWAGVIAAFSSPLFNAQTPSITVYGYTDQPSYKPNQMVTLKFWVYNGGPVDLILYNVSIYYPWYNTIWDGNMTVQPSSSTVISAHGGNWSDTISFIVPNDGRATGGNITIEVVTDKITSSSYIPLNVAGVPTYVVLQSVNEPTTLFLAVIVVMIICTAILAAVILVYGRRSRTKVPEADAQK